MYLGGEDRVISTSDEGPVVLTVTGGYCGARSYWTAQ